MQEQNTHLGEEIKKYKDSDGNVEDHLVSQQLETKTVMMLSFSEDQRFSKAAYSQDQNESGLSSTNQQSFLRSTFLDNSNMKETKEVSKVSEELSSEVLSFEEDKNVDISCSEGEIEPSTDEELKMWRYPQERQCKDEESALAGKEEVFTEEGESELGIDSFTNHADSQRGEVSAVELKGAEYQPKEEELKSGGCFNDSDTAIEGDIQESSQIGGNDRLLDHSEMELDSGDERQDVADKQIKQIHKAAGGDGSKKVTFILEPELINSSNLPESITSMESTAELGLSGEMRLKM